MQTQQIKLTPAQAKLADWVMGCPLFETDQETLEWEHGLDPDKAQEVLEAIGQTKLQGQVWTLPNNEYVLDYIIDSCDQSVDMADGAFEDALDRGLSEKGAEACANNHARLAQNLKAKVKEFRRGC